MTIFFIVFNQGCDCRPFVHYRQQSDARAPRQARPRQTPSSIEKYPFCPFLNVWRAKLAEEFRCPGASEVQYSISDNLSHLGTQRWRVRSSGLRSKAFSYAVIALKNDMRAARVRADPSVTHAPPCDGVEGRSVPGSPTRALPPGCPKLAEVQRDEVRCLQERRQRLCGPHQ